MHKLNIHAHTAYYSDGFDSVETMYNQYMKEDFSVAVFTDHVYSIEIQHFGQLLEHPSMSLDPGFHTPLPITWAGL